MINQRTATLVLTLTTAVALGCAKNPNSEQQVLRLATTTSTRDSGLLEVLLPPFEKEHNIRVDVIAVGTGKALKLGAAGDADLVLVHARAAEVEFMAAGLGIRRADIMQNRFELLGPPEDPAGIAGLAPNAALQKIAASGHRFVSRSDESGTHQREQALWESSGGRSDWPDYIETGQGMGSSLIIADELRAYVLCDRGTFLHLRGKIDLVPLVTGSPELANPYGAIVVNPAVHTAVKVELAQKLLDHLVADRTQRAIGQYRLADEQLFQPAHLTE